MDLGPVMGSAHEGEKNGQVMELALIHDVTQRFEARRGIRCLEEGVRCAGEDRFF